MFDIGFSEMGLIAIVALLVLGPERLPRVARQVGAWMGKLQRYVADVKSDINRQMDMDDLRKLQSEVKDAASSFESSVNSAVSGAQTEFNSIQSTLETPPGTPDPAATDWDKIYAVRRQRERVKDRRREREKELGIKRPKRSFHRP
jgi:sec-independent protein translocase protein TatB